MIQVKTLAVAWCNFVTWILYFVNMCEYTNMKSIEDGVILNKINVFKTISMELFMDNIFYRTDVCMHVCLCGCVCDLMTFTVYYGQVALARWGRNEIDNILQTIFLNVFFFNENVWISIKISLKFVVKGPINNIPTLVQIMAWCRSGDEPLSEPMMVRLPTHICVTRHVIQDDLNILCTTPVLIHEQMMWGIDAYSGLWPMMPWC